MNKYFFINNEIITKLFILFIAMILFGFYQLALIEILLCSFLGFLFRNKEMNLNDIRLSEKSLLISPVSGRYMQKTETSDSAVVNFEISLIDGYGLYMPVNGEILDFQESILNHKNFLKPYRCELLIQDKSQLDYKIIINGLSSIFRPRIYVRAGDKGRIGGLLGFIPFGGKVSLEIPTHCEVVMSNYDKIISSQTVIGKVEERV